MFVWNCLTPAELDPDIDGLGELFDYDDEEQLRSVNVPAHNTLMDDLATLARPSDPILVLNEDAILNPVFKGQGYGDEVRYDRVRYDDDDEDDDDDERDLEEAGDQHAKNLRFGRAASAYKKAAAIHAQKEREARYDGGHRLAQYHKESGQRLLRQARKYGAISGAGEFGQPSFESLYQSAADTGTVPEKDELGPGTGYVGNAASFSALMPVPPVLTSNSSSVHAGVRYDLQAEIASAMDDAILPLPKPVW